MSCTAVTDAYVKETGRINGNEIFRRTVRTRPINELSMANRGAWENGMGVVVSNLTMGRNMPLQPAASRTNVSASDGASTDACAPPIITLKDGQITQSYQLRHLALQTKEYCINDIRTSVQFAKQAGMKIKELARITAWVWADWFTVDYVDQSAHNLTIQTTGTWDNGSNGYSTTHPPTGGLSMGLLEDIQNQINAEGELPYATDEDTGAPVSICLCSDIAFRRLLRDNPTLEQTIRYAWMGAKDDMPTLPGGMGKKRRTFGGWIFITDLYSRRFNQVGGSGNAYTQVDALSEVVVTNGTSQNLSDAYRYAQFEEFLCYNPNTYRSLAPNYTTVGDGWTFNPHDYAGQFKALNILSKDCNPRGDKIFFDAVFSDAAEPLNPNVGYTGLIKNCGYDRTGTTCTAAASSSSA